MKRGTLSNDQQPAGSDGSRECPPYTVTGTGEVPVCVMIPPKSPEQANAFETKQELRTVHPMGVPESLGFIATGIANASAGFLNAGWASLGFSLVVMSWALMSGGFVQLLVGVLEFVKGDTFGGVTFGTFGAWWLGYFLYNFVLLERIPQGDYAAKSRVGDLLFYIFWGCVTLSFMFVGLRKNHCCIVFFGLLAASYILYGIGAYSSTVTMAGGYVGVAAGVTAIYFGIALMMKEEIGWTLPGLRNHQYI